MKETKCLINNCNDEAITRGLCPKCYASARSMVNNDQTTWAFLEKKGLAKEATRGATSPFREQFNKMFKD